ncbi:MAG: cobyrinate a,c-diamide synthase [Desulfobacterales bacterium]|nr:cobyrinate a,c-diamide synthase [Desulfobacterales bacterium]
MNQKTVKGVVIAAPASGSGKTTFTLGLLAALKNRGMKPAGFKIGPDFIDPGLHSMITGLPGRNLDGWMLDRSVNLEIFARGARDADIAVAEGVMGLFDGFSGASEAGSTAQMAKWLGLPVLLVADASKTARSFAALVKGFAEFDPDCTICGVAANNIAGPGHLKYLEEAMQQVPEVPFLGGIPRNSRAALPERHLGLFTAEDRVLTECRVDELASLISDNLDLAGLVEMLPEIPAAAPDRPARPGSGCRVAVARDAAFCFYYEDNLDVLREQGCETVFFSPVNDRKLPDRIHGLYLGGGYPELYASALSQNDSMRDSIRRHCRAGMPAYAECGGFMYLCRQMTDVEESTFDMAGVFPFATRMQKRLAALGYREIRLTRDTPLGPAGTVMRGHEFHYSRMENTDESAGVRSAYAVADRTGANRGASGWLSSRCLGSYVHLHFRSQAAIGGHFARICRQFQNERQNRNEAP